MRKSKYDASEIWENLCDFVRQDEKPPAYECGDWTIDKLHFLCRYLAIVSNAMKSHPKFKGGINYIDLFCGSGVCVAPKNTPNQKRYPGSALLAAGCPKCFDHMFLVDADPSNIEAVSKRIQRLGCHSALDIFAEDANSAVDEIVRRIPRQSLSIAFIDPFNLGFYFESLQALTSEHLMDLVILFPDAMDVVRNTDRYYVRNTNSPLDLVLGQAANWRPAYEKLMNRPGHAVSQFFREVYVDQIRDLGYMCFDTTKVLLDNGKPLYRLIYASKNELGLKFWHIALEEDRQGQRGLFN